MADEIDIVLPLCHNTFRKHIELRYALRSIEQFATGWRRVIIIGCDPGFLSDSEKVHVIKMDEFHCNKEARIATKVKWAFENIPDISDYVAFWNDDFVLMKKTDVRKIPFNRCAVDLIQMGNGMNGRYGKSLKITGQLLRKAERPFWNYDIHTPIVFERDAFLSLEPYWWTQSRIVPCGLVMKSIYCNVHLSKPGPVVMDCKLRDGKDLQKFAGKWVFSYADSALKTGLSEFLLKKFPVPSSLEK